MMMRVNSDHVDDGDVIRVGGGGGDRFPQSGVRWTGRER